MAAPEPKRHVLVTMSGPASLVCELEAAKAMGLSMVDLMARLQLAATRMGCTVSFRGATPELRHLLRLAGLIDVLRCDPAPGIETELGIQVGREAEHGEHPLGVEEEGDPRDPIC